MSEHSEAGSPGPILDRYRVKLIRNTKGYGWEISAGGDTPAQALSDVRMMDSTLRQDYGGDAS